MKNLCVSFIVLALASCVADAAGETPIKQVAKEKVVELSDAVIKEDHGKVVDLTLPKLVEEGGGREKLISTLESWSKQMKSQGFAFVSGKVDDPSDPVMAGTDLYIVVPFTMEMKTPKGKVRQKSFV
jgi:hypothetical protein